MLCLGPPDSPRVPRTCAGASRQHCSRQVGQSVQAGVSGFPSQSCTQPCTAGPRGLRPREPLPPVPPQRRREAAERGEVLVRVDARGRSMGSSVLPLPRAFPEAAARPGRFLQLEANDCGLRWGPPRQVSCSSRLGDASGTPAAGLASENRKSLLHTHSWGRPSLGNYIDFISAAPREPGQDSGCTSWPLMAQTLEMHLFPGHTLPPGEGEDRTGSALLKCKGTRGSRRSQFQGCKN